MLPIVRPQSPARVRVGWPPFAGISLPVAEALRLLIMDYEQDVFVPAPEMCRPPRGQPRAYTPIEPQCHDAAVPSFVFTLRPSASRRTGDRSEARRRPQPKAREVTATITRGMALKTASRPALGATFSGGAS